MSERDVCLSAEQFLEVHLSVNGRCMNKRDVYLSAGTVSNSASVCGRLAHE
jgi:hypothetical protein